jgi:hypothetical protein
MYTRVGAGAVVVTAVVSFVQIRGAFCVSHIPGSYRLPPQAVGTNAEASAVSDLCRQAEIE